MELNRNEVGHSEEKVSAKGNIKQELQEFSQATTLHGIRYITGIGIHRLRRMIWVVFLIAIYVFLIYELRGSFMKFMAYPVSTIVNINHVHDVPFPAVTICNQNMITADSLEKEDPVVIQVMEARTNEEVDIDWEDFYNHTKDHAPWNITQMAFDDGHKIEDMLMGCHWQLHDTCTAADFAPRITDFGVCFTFNYDEDNPLKVTHPGSSYGLSITLDIQQDQYTWSEYGGAGLKMYVHPQTELPLVKLHGFLVAPGFETDVTLRHVKRNNLRSPYEPFCDEKTLKYSHGYDAALCRYECEVDALIALCGCKDFRYPGPARVCSPQEQIDCILQNEEFVADTDNLNCSCPEPCEREYYESQISIAQWPSNYYRRKLAKKLNITEEYIIDNFMEVNIFFEEVQLEEISETPSYDGYSLFGDIGGYMGLLCGASLISLGEIVDFIVVTCTRYRRG